MTTSTPGFSVSPAALKQGAGHAATIGDGLLDDVRSTSGGLAVVGGHANWAISGALSRVADAWELELMNTSKALLGVGDTLTSCAESYDTVDKNAAAGLTRSE